jgi:hypothetical protein
LKEDGCTDLVQNVWNMCFLGGADSVNEGLSQVSKVMIDWSRNILGDLEKRIKKLKKVLARCLKGPLNQESIN